MAEQDVKLKTFARTPSSWDPQDDLLLRRLKEQQKLGWKEISSHFQNRTPNACQFRWRRLRSGSLKGSSSVSSISSSSNSISSLSQQFEDSKLSQIQPKTIRRHSLLSSSNPTSNISTPVISNTSRSGSFTDLQSTNSVSSNESNPQKQRMRSYSTNSSTSSFLYHHDDPLSTHHYSSLPQHHLSNNLNLHHHLNPHHLIQKNQFPRPQQQPPQQQQQQVWEEDEDDLLMSRRERELSFTELSILLPSKSEMDIWLRIEYLDTKNGITATNSVPSNRKNSIPQLSRSLSISSSISNQSSNLPFLQSRENSISLINNNNNNNNTIDMVPKQEQQQQQPFQLPNNNGIIKEEKDFTKKRSIKLPSLGSILNNF